MVLRALIWDVDGTLAETERDGHRVAFNRAFDDAGLAWHWDAATYGELLKVTGGKERMLHWWRGLDPVAAAAPSANTEDDTMTSGSSETCRCSEQSSAQTISTTAAGSASQAALAIRRAGKAP